MVKTNDRMQWQKQIKPTKRFYQINLLNFSFVKKISATPTGLVGADCAMPNKNFELPVFDGVMPVPNSRINLSFLAADAEAKTRNKVVWEHYKKIYHKLTWLGRSLVLWSVGIWTRTTGTSTGVRGVSDATIGTFPTAGGFRWKIKTKFSWEIIRSSFYNMEQSEKDLQINYSGFQLQIKIIPTYPPAYNTLKQ